MAVSVNTAADLAAFVGQEIGTTILAKRIFLGKPIQRARWNTWEYWKARLRS
jgi:hypothetical protein